MTETTKQMFIRKEAPIGCPIFIAEEAWSISGVSWEKKTEILHKMYRIYKVTKEQCNA